MSKELLRLIKRDGMVIPVYKVVSEEEGEPVSQEAVDEKYKDFLMKWDGVKEQLDELFDEEKVIKTELLKMQEIVSDEVKVDFEQPGEMLIDKEDEEEEVLPEQESEHNYQE